MIRQIGGRYTVLSSDGSREFGTYETREEAEQRLLQIERFSKARGRVGDIVTSGVEGGTLRGKVLQILTEGTFKDKEPRKRIENAHLRATRARPISLIQIYAGDKPTQELVAAQHNLLRVEGSPTKKAEGLRTGDFVSWSTSGSSARGRIKRIVRDGKVSIPDSSFVLNATSDDPVALITLYRDGKRTDRTVGQKLKRLRRISPFSKMQPTSGQVHVPSTSRRRRQKLEAAADTYTPPVGVARTAARAQQWIKDGKAGGGFTDVGRKRAAQLASRQPVSLETIKRMNSFLARHSVNRNVAGYRLGEKGFPTPGRVAFDAWGGDAARSWVKSILRRVENQEKVSKHYPGGKDHDQVRHGTWSPGGSKKAPSAKPTSPDKRPKVYRTTNFKEALTRLAKGEVVEFKSTKQVHTFLKDLADYAKEASERGEEIPNLDLCKVSVPGTNLFCKNNLGIPRVKMPQLEGTPVEGSPADKMPREKNGNVNVGPEFVKRLRASGVDVKDKTLKASHLSASQNQLVGGKVAALMEPDRREGLKSGRIFVSRDGYVIDGHHRWAAIVGLDAGDAKLGDATIKVTEIDMPIAEVLQYANDFTEEIGIKPQVAKRLIELDGQDLTLEKAMERQFTMGPLYIPDSVDAHGEFTDSDELQKAVWEYVRKGDRRIRLQHNKEVVAGEWVEVLTWPYEMTMQSKLSDGSVRKQEYPANTVFMGVVWKDWAWDMVKAGKLRGYSIGGKAERIDVELED